MKVGIYFAASGNNGGVYQYSLSLLDALRRISGNEYFILSSSNIIPERFFNNKRFKVVRVAVDEGSLFRVLRIVCSLLSRQLVRFDFESLSIYFDKLAQKKVMGRISDIGLDAVFYPVPSSLSYLLPIPSIVAVHDVEHKIKPIFKEVSAGGVWKERELNHRNICATARYLLVPSEIGREDVINSYGTSSKKIIILPHLPPYYLNPNIKNDQINKVKIKFNLPDDFILYPAKFWPHKNHLNLIKAVKVLDKKHKKVNLILVGSTKADYSIYEEVMVTTNQLNIQDRVKVLGYVSDIELSALYKLAKAMVMPTYLGPTNIPILEGWLMGTPVITSNIRGCRDQLGHAGLLVDPNNPEDIAMKIEKVYYNDKLRKELVLLGKKMLNSWNEISFSNEIKHILDLMKQESSV